MDKLLEKEWVVVYLTRSRAVQSRWQSGMDTFAKIVNLAKTCEKGAGKLPQPIHYGVKNIRTGSILPAVIL